MPIGLMDFRVRTMTAEDVPDAMRLKDAAGWNQTGSDWIRFLSASHEGCFAAEYQGEVIGTSATISYENRISWIGMLIVDERYRGKGIGTALLKTAIRFLDSKKMATIKLDATPLGRPLYEKLGFMTEYDIERWMLSRTVVEPGRENGPVSIEAVLPVDREIFGSDRSGLLLSLAHESPHLALIEQQEGKITGYCLGRQGSLADHMGPWVAYSRDTAERLLNLFLLRSRRDQIFVDCLRLNPWAIQIVKASGFRFSRPLTRMYRGTNRYPGESEPLCASLGPEFG